MISEEVIGMSLILGVLNYLLFAIVVTHTMHRYADPIERPPESDTEESEASDMPRAA